MKPQFKNITFHAKLPESITGQEELGAGWTFDAERGTVYAYEWVRDGHSLAVVPLGNLEFTYATPELAAASSELLEFAIGEGMFPSFTQSIGEAIRTAVDNISVELMSDRASGDIAPDQVDQIDDAVETIARVLVNVWLNNPAKAVQS